MYGSIRKELGPIMRELAQQKESEVEEGHLMGDHVHMMLTIPPKYSVSGVVGYIKGKSAIAIARRFMDRKKNFVGLNFWARGYYVSTVGRDERQVRQYIREQEKEDRRRAAGASGKPGFQAERPKKGLLSRWEDLPRRGELRSRGESIQ